VLGGLADPSHKGRTVGLEVKDMAPLPSRLYASGRRFRLSDTSRQVFKYSIMGRRSAITVQSREFATCETL